MQVFPAMFPMAGRRVVVVGGGDAAQRKVRLVAKTPAEITIIAPAFSAELKAEFEHRVHWVERAVKAADFQGATLTIIAEEDAGRAAAAACLARRAGIPVNAVDRPELCDWNTPAIVDRDEVVIAIATGGSAPIIARDLRAKIEAMAPQGIGVLARLARAIRSRVADRFVGAAERRSFWTRALRGAAAEYAYAGDADAAEAELERALNEPNKGGGVVHIVGAGPGDPELLTLKALRVINDADVVYYDALVSEGVMELVRRDADRIYVGKRKAAHSVPQEQIHARLVADAHAGKRVVRLKGGDPFVFGRGGEELEALEAAGVTTAVVPGISSALGCAASAGVPLTHRDHAPAVTFVTGHAKHGEPDLDWPALARVNQTVVVFMGVGAAPKITARLIEAGRAPSTPVAVIENGTLPQEKVVTGTLSSIAGVMAAAGIVGPALIIIGEVAGAAHIRAITAHAAQLENVA